MNLDEQIKYTEDELTAYEKANFACPTIILWLKGILESLYKLKGLEK